MLERIVSPFKQFGFIAGLLYATDRVLARIGQTRLYFYDLMVQPIPDKPLLPARYTERLRVREIKRGDPELTLMPPRAEIRQARFDQNATCLGAFREGEFVGYLWFCSRAYDEDEVRCTFVPSPENEAIFDFDFYIFPEHRLGIAFAALWSEAGKYLRSRGIRYTFSRLTRFNTASLRAHRHLGWRPVGRAIFLRAWALQIMIATVAPYFHVSLRDTDRVRLELRPDALTGAP